jgi:hypothetical protein
MISRERLLSHQKELRDEWVLSVYVDGSQVDPAERRAWRRKLDAMTDALGRRLADDESLEAFQAALARIKSELHGYEGFLPHRGWVGFATEHALELAEGLPFPAIDVVRWERGPWVSPFIRALKSARPVEVALADARRARVLRYGGGTLAERQEFQADDVIDDLSDAGMMKSSATATGVRGQTARDAAQRTLQVETDRMIRRVVDAVKTAAGTGGAVILGGTPEAVAALRSGLGERLASRSLEVPSLYVDIGMSDLERHVSAAATSLTQARHMEELTSILDLAGADGRACLGAEAVEKALDVGAVDTLYLARELIDASPELTETLVRRVLDQGGDVEELGGDAGDRLADEGKGVAARLRFGTRGEGAG